MKIHRSTSLLVGLIFLFILAACGGRASTPVTNPPGVETSLASTALALAKQTEAANPYTATPSPTSTETPTPTARISTSGTSLEVRQDESKLFTDHKLGFQLAVPAGWLTVRLNEDEYYKAFNLEAVAGNPAIVDYLSKIQTLDGDHVRLVAIDLRPADETNGLLSGISVVLQPETIKTMDDWVIANPGRANKRKDYVLLSSGYQDVTSDIRALVRDERWSSATKEKVFSRTVVFNLPAGILTLDFETSLDSKDTLLPDFEQVVSSVTLLSP